jgi:3-oxoacyl-[acyl-carrier protein] reductase
VFSLNGKACLVIGGSGGIGREIALGLAEQEADVALTYLRRADVAAGLVDRITGLGRRAMALACDVVQSAGLEECVAETHRRFGRLDVASPAD